MKLCLAANWEMLDRLRSMETALDRLQDRIVGQDCRQESAVGNM